MDKRSGVKKDGWNLFWSVVSYLAVLVLVAVLGVVFMRSGTVTTNPVVEIRQYSRPVDPNNFHTAVLPKSLSGGQAFV
jgi:hypothetical protein